MLVAILIVSNLTLFILGFMVFSIFYCAKQDRKRDLEIAKLKDCVDTSKIRFNMLNETFAEYREQFPIKTKYRVGSFVFIVENKKVFHGVIVEIHQGQARDITYTVQYAENNKAVNKVIVREQRKVYKTLADAIEAEKLVSL